jgi:hypothetical protein
MNEMVNSSKHELPGHPRQLNPTDFPEYRSVFEDWMSYESTLQKASICILTVNNEHQPIVAGTGFVLEVDGQYFLITASHVIQDQVRENRCLYLLDQAGIGPGSEFTNRFGTSPGIDSDPFDSAFCRLTPDQIQRLLANGLRPIPFEECDPSNNVGENGLAMFFGYPENKAKRWLTDVYAVGTRRTAACSINPKLLNRFENAKSEFNFVMPSQRMEDIDSGRKLNLDFFAGYSGSPIWSVPSSVEWIGGQRPKIIGIVTSRSKKVPNPILATKAWSILSSLRDYFGIEYGRTRLIMK